MILILSGQYLRQSYRNDYGQWEMKFMLPYGKSNDGTPHVYSKEGIQFKAGVYKLDDAMKIQKAINNSEVKSIKYYNYVGK